MPKYKIADVVFEAKTNYKYTSLICKDYEYFGQEEVAFSTQITTQDIIDEKKLAPNFPDDLLESLSLFRKLCNYVLDNADGIIFHCSAIMVDNEAYLFTAPSGTGKSTHTRLWREMLGEKAIMVNDDKPIIRLIDNEFFVYGTPWKGKHDLGNNCRAKIKAICQIYQNEENVIKKLKPSQILMTILNQTIRPKEISKMDKLLNLIDKMLNSVSLYSLGCNISREAAELSYNTMSRGI